MLFHHTLLMLPDFANVEWQVPLRTAGRFLLDRFCRIYPPYIVAMVLAALGSIWLGGHTLASASIYFNTPGWVLQPSWAASQWFRLGWPAGWLADLLVSLAGKAGPHCRLWRRSYSLYLMHLLVVMTIIGACHGTVPLWACATVLPVSIALAAGFQRWVEVPSIKWTQVALGYTPRSPRLRRPVLSPLIKFIPNAAMAKGLAHPQ